MYDTSKRAGRCIDIDVILRCIIIIIIVMGDTEIRDKSCGEQESSEEESGEWVYIIISTIQSW